MPLVLFARQKTGRRRLEGLAARYHEEVMLRRAMWVWRVRKSVKISCEHQMSNGELFEENRSKSLAFMTWQVRTGGLPALMRQAAV